MKIKGIILGVLLACAVGISFPLYSLYMQENITEQEAYKIGEEIFKQTTWHENPVIEISDSGRVWHVHTLCDYSTYSTAYFVEISKRTGKVVKVNFDHIFTEE